MCQQIGLIGRCKRHLRRRLEIKSLNGVCRRHASGGVRGSSSSLDRSHLIISLFGLRPRQKGGRKGGDRIGRDNLEASMREATRQRRRFTDQILAPLSCSPAAGCRPSSAHLVAPYASLSWFRFGSTKKGQWHSAVFFAVSLTEKVRPNGSREVDGCTKLHI